jgi:hypothetical protein
LNNIYPKCHICGNTPSKGLFDGFRLEGKFICAVCEAGILVSDMGTQEYQTYMQSIREILYT